MTEIVILDNASQLTEEQQKQLLNLHYSFLNFQRTALSADLPKPDLKVHTLFLGNKIGIAMENDRPIGYCIYRIIAGVLKLRTLFVLESHRRTGIMTRLLDSVREVAVFWQAQLTIHKNCKAAHQFFEGRGYQSKVDGDWVQLAFFQTEDAGEKPVVATA